MFPYWFDCRDDGIYNEKKRGNPICTQFTTSESNFRSWENEMRTVILFPYWFDSHDDGIFSISSI
ncbi:hypothetical protein V6Z11_D11G143000 [Gossypium hirsutum]